MKFTELYILLLIPPVLIVAVALCIACGRKKRELLRKLLGNSADDPGAVHLAGGKRKLKYFFLLLSLVLLIFGAARPFWNESMVVSSAPGRDIMVLFDVSKSMRAADLPPSRLEQAKYLLRQIVDNSSGDRFGIVAFAGNAFLSCPLTADRSALKDYISELDVNSVPMGGTNIERALRVADKAFDGAESGHRAVLLLTDGDELSGDAGKIVAALKKKHIPILVAGFGDPAISAAVPDGKGGVMRDNTGNPAASRLDEKKLRNLADRTGGVYVRSTVTDTGFETLRRRLDQLAEKRNESGNRMIPEDRFPLFLTAGWLLLLLSALISERPGRGVLLLAVALLPCTGTGGELPKENLPADPAELYNLALKYQREGNENAPKLYEESIRSASGNPALQAKALQNLGVMIHSAGRVNLKRAEVLMNSQQSDAALKELDEARNKLDRSGELYTHILGFDKVDVSDVSANSSQLELDLDKLEELKKKIEEQKPERSPDKPEQSPDKPEQLPDKPEQSPDKPEQSPDKPEQSPDKPEQSPDKPEFDRSEANEPRSESSDKLQETEKSGERKLKMLNDESRQLREAVRKYAAPRRDDVEKDW